MPLLGTMREVNLQIKDQSPFDYRMTRIVLFSELNLENSILSLVVVKLQKRHMRNAS
jgi:hypothetical protein